MIQRKLENKICKLLVHFPVVGILGPRQVGKTTLAKSLISNIKKKSAYLDLERFEDYSKLTNPSLFLEPLQDSCIIIDEIQRKPELFPELRSLIDRNRVPARFLILGSASPSLLKQSSESLAGRIAYTELSPFHLGEISSDDQNKLWFNGGFPDAFLTNDPFYWINWQNSFITTYVERDLPSAGLNASPTQLRTFINMLASIQGNMLNMHTISRSMGMAFNTVSKYIDFFESAFLIRRLLPFHVNNKKRIVKTPKIYIRDTGLYHYLMGLSDITQLFGHISLGASWETFVIEEIISNIDQRTEAWFYRTQDGTECDLVLTRAGKPVVCVEAKITSQPSKTKSFTTTIIDLGTTQNFIIVPNCPKQYALSHVITVIGISEFVNDVLPNL